MASVHGRVVDGVLYATDLRFLELDVREEPYEFAKSTPTNFLFNKLVNHRNDHGAAAAPEQDLSIATTAGVVVPLPDEQWQAAKALIRDAIPVKPRTPIRDRAQGLRELVEIIRLELGTPYTWSKYPGDRKPVQSASVLLSKLQRENIWENVIAATAEEGSS